MHLAQTAIRRGEVTLEFARLFDRHLIRNLDYPGSVHAVAEETSTHLLRGDGTAEERPRHLERRDSTRLSRARLEIGHVEHIRTGLDSERSSRAHHPLGNHDV